jgi:hypothetical protein
MARKSVSGDQRSSGPYSKEPGRWVPHGRHLAPMEIELEKGVLNRVLRQPSVKADEREALHQPGAMTVNEHLEVVRPLLVPAQSAAPLPTGRVYGCDLVRGSSGVCFRPFAE